MFRERCFDAGLDACVTKPMQGRCPNDAIKTTWENMKPGTPKGKLPSNFILDRSAVFNRVGGNPEVIKTVVKMFNEDSPAQLSHIGEAIRSGDAKSLLAFAHTLKGSLLVLAADEAAKIAEKLENMGRTGDLSGAGDVLLQLESDIAIVSVALQDLVNDLA